jgi:SAM-dependent methyltransferase
LKPEDESITECILCGQRNLFISKHLPTQPLEHRWSAIGYDLASSFPQLKDGISKWQCVDCDLRFFVPQAVGASDLYAALGHNPAYYTAAKWEFEFVLRRLAKRKRGGSILEFGCGPGRFLERAAPYFERALGLDFNDEAVRDGRARGLNISGRGLDELEETFDTIAAFQVIEHVPAPGEILSQLAKLLRPGGELIIAVPNEDSFLGALYRNHLNLPPHHVSCWTRASFDSVAQLLALNLETYACEPLSLDLYLGAMHERFDTHLSNSNVLMLPLLWLIRRASIARALISFDLLRRNEPGHTHIAFFRKPIS